MGGACSTCEKISSHAPAGFTSIAQGQSSPEKPFADLFAPKPTQERRPREANPFQQKTALADDRILLLRFREVMKKSFRDPREAFDILDKNKDNSVSKDEWLTTLDDVAEIARWDCDTMVMMKIWGEQFFNELDLNGNGLLTFMEFKVALVKKLGPCQGLANLSRFKECMKQSFSNPKDAFELLDVNGDGKVTKTEWLQTLGMVGESVGWDEATLDMMDDFGAAFYDQLDTNLNGELSYKEFKENLKRNLGTER